MKSLQTSSKIALPGKMLKIGVTKTDSPAFHQFKALIFLVLTAPSNWFKVTLIFSTCLQHCRVIKVEDGRKLGAVASFRYLKTTAFI